jgi:anaphase-promoting complex subunit 2
LADFQLLFTISLQRRHEAVWENKNESLPEQEDWMVNLQQLRWIDNEVQEPLDRALEETIVAHVSSCIAGEFYQDCLMDEIMEWSTKVLHPWIQNLLGGDLITLWKPRLTAAVQHAFVRIRLDELFDLVADYPDSHPAVLELAAVLQQTHLHQELGQALQTSLERRLIHPGAATSQIIDVYIHAIKVLRVVDPSDRLLQVVAEPVRAYLRGRKDTVRCIITSLTSGDLYEELRRNDAKPLEDAQGDDEEEECPTLDWCPKPPLSQQRGSFFGMQSNNKTLDILSILVSIYGSKELFVDEYRLVLADKLLANLDYNTDKEVHTLELLKLRFGEQSMRQCEIMIKDTDDSKRILNNIHSRNSVKDEWKVDAAIVSHIFWPSLQKESLKHHEKIQAKLDAFSDGYYSLKNPRKLVWLDQLGTVQLELDVIEHDGTQNTKEFTCSPLHATLISHFEDQEEWSLEELTLRLELPDEHVVAKKLAYWVNQRVLMLNSMGRYEIASPSNWNQAVHHTEEDASQQVLGAQQDDALEVYESYVLGMLQRLEELSLDRIHNNLKMFATSGSDHQYNMTMRQLSSFLQKLCKDEKLECGAGGMYKLLKK